MAQVPEGRGDVATSPPKGMASMVVQRLGYPSQGMSRHPMGFAETW